MRVHALRLRNFRQFADKTIDFCDSAGEPRACTVLVGPNMSGKTTIMDALHLVYESVAFPRTGPNWRPGFNHDRPSRNDSQEILLDLTFSLDEQELTDLNYLAAAVGEADQTAPPSEVYTVRLSWPPHSNGLALYGGEPTDGWRALTGRQWAMLARRQRIASVHLENVGGLFYLSQDRSLKLKIPSIDTDTEEGLRARAMQGDIVPWLEFVNRLDQKWDQTAGGESAWNRIKRLYSRLAAPSSIDDIEASDAGFDLRFRSEGRGYYARELSGGERQLLGLVVQLAAFRARRSIVLLDELELHLHPQWQRNLLHFCRRGGDDGNQFILSTHSESLVTVLDPEEIVEVGQLVAQ